MRKVKQAHGGVLSIPEKGETNNPNGKPKGIKNRSTIARKVLDMKGIIPEEALTKLREVFPDITNEMTMEEVMTIIQAGKAVTKQDSFAYQVLMDSAYGKAKQEVEVSGETASRIEYVNIYDPKKDPERLD